MTVDLHLHSNISDGLFSPEEIYPKIKAAGLKIISLTDHDSCSGYERLKQTGRNDDIKIIRGIEFSANYDNTEVHILGYFRNGISQELAEFIAHAQSDREQRISEALLNLRAEGIALNRDDLMPFCQGESIGRNHLAQLLVSRGYVKTPLQAFQEYLKYDLNIVPRTKTSATEAIEKIKAAEGVSIWAHPPFRLFDKYLGKLVELGLDGVEAYNRRKTANNSFYYHTVAEKEGLLTTAGSDWHGLPDEEFLSVDCYPAQTLDEFMERVL